MSTLFHVFASCPRYLEGLLNSEVRSLAGDGGTLAHTKETQGGVFIECSLEVAYRLCLWSRLASRILVKVADGAPRNADELYSLATSVPWWDHFSPKTTFAVDAHVRHREFRNPGFASLKVKDAVVDSFRGQGLARPNVNTDAPDIRLFVYLTETGGSIYLDLSGESLHRRGYRRDATEAPVRENSAAAVLSRVGWPDAVSRWQEGGDLPFLADPLCGSGTIVIEAALIAMDIAPGILREQYGFQSWHHHDPALWRKVLLEAQERREAGQERWAENGGRLWASDLDDEAVGAARKNAGRAGVDGAIDFGTQDFKRLTRGAILGRLNKAYTGDRNAPFYVVTNPPYGVRLSQETDPESLYEELGRWLSATFSGFTAGVLGGSKEHLRSLGLRAQKVNVLYNGNLKVFLATLLVDEDNSFAPPDTTEQGDSELRNRLEKNLKRLKPYLNDDEVSCYRLYDADIPQYAAAIDVYHDLRGSRWLVVQEYAPPKTIDPKTSEERFKEIVEDSSAFMEVSADRVVTKQRKRQRGAAQYGRSGGPASTMVVVEDGLHFQVNLSDYIDTGLFLDARLLRSRIGEESQGKRFLNLFSYTCTASVYAAAAGAETTSVDTSATYLAWGRRNFELNRIPTRNHHFVRAEAFDYFQNGPLRFDIILVDPPTYSNSKGRERDFDVQRDHEELIRLSFEHLADGGAVFFSTNFRKFRLSQGILSEFRVTDLTQETTPPDFARRKNFRSTWRLERRSDGH